MANFQRYKFWVLMEDYLRFIDHSGMYALGDSPSGLANFISGYSWAKQDGVFDRGQEWLESKFHVKTTVHILAYLAMNAKNYAEFKSYTKEYLQFVYEP